MAGYGFSYVLPDIVPDEAGYSKDVVKQAYMMPQGELITIVMDNYLEKINVEELKSSTYYDKYKFSMYDKLYKIPPYSYVSISAWRSFVEVLTQMIGIYGPKERDVKRTFLTNFFGIESYFFYMASQPTNLFLRMNVLDEFGKYRATRKEKPLEYKIHLCVKEEYAFYAFLKLGFVFFPAFRQVYPDHYLEMKWNLDARMTHLQPGNVVYRKNNGGPAASIVIYTRTSTKEVIIFMLRTLLTGFPEADTIGFMELTGKETLPYANVRLNKMLCYAQGDRVTKLMAKRNNLTKKNGTRSQKYIPDWILDIQTNCPSEEANQMSQLYLGVDICPTGDLLQDTQCIDDLCYLAIDKNMVDPRSIVAKGGKYRKTLRTKK
jgi:hypothetical protein